jgi:CMP-N,N'-diacetyllegionaminic acid synthase
MIDGKKVLAVISARGGSKRLPRKNLLAVLGKPLIAWTIEEARKSQYIDRLIVSSEDSEIIRVSAEWGCDAPFVRPPELAMDETPGIEPILHALGQLPNYEYVVLLQPTSPLRTVEDIDACIAKCHNAGSPACVSVTKCCENPVVMFQLSASELIIPLFRDALSLECGQNHSPIYKLNGAVYVARSAWVTISKSFISKDTLGYEMPNERSLDIDSYSDFSEFANLMKGREQWTLSD